MKKKHTFLKILIVLIVLAAIGAGGYYAYLRFFAGETGEGTVYVQSVTAITGIGPAGINNRYTGVIEAKNVIDVNPDKDLTIKECFVTAGDKVEKGDPLFSYDVDSLQLSYEQLKLDILGLENDIKTGGEKLESLKKQLAKARENKKYDIQMNIQTQDLEIRKKQYELSGKQEQAADMEKALENTTVFSPVTGTVRSVKSENDQQSYGYGYGYGTGTESTAYITIVAGNDYCVKGTVSEQTIHTLQEGMPVQIISRVDGTVRSGSIYKINTEEPVQSESRYYYYDDGSTEKASKYAFYVELDSIEGLIMGQHVYIEPGVKNDGSEEAGIPLPFYYLAEEDGRQFVYAANAEGRIEKRFVETGAQDEDTGNIMILSGLDYTDRIAFPDDTVRVGMPVSETAYVPDAGDFSDSAGMTGMFDSSMDMGMTGDFGVFEDKEYTDDMLFVPEQEMPEPEVPAGGLE